MGFTYEQSGSLLRRMYSSVNIATGNVIIDNGEGKPLRENDGSLASRSTGIAAAGQTKFKRLLSQAGKPIRVQQSIKLCDVDGDRHKTDKCLAVMLLAERLETSVREWEASADKSDGTEELRPDMNMTVADFFTNVFMPHIIEHREASTAKSYQDVYDHYLDPHFNHTKTLRGYEAFQGTNLLERMAATYSDSVINNTRALASSIFKYACSKGFIKQNPWRDVVKTTDGQDVEDGYAYNDAEVEQIVAAIETTVEKGGRVKRGAQTAQMAVMVGYFLGLRPSETAGLRWEKVDLVNNRVTIDSACVAGNFKGTKNAKVRVLDILDPLTRWFKVWAAGKDTTSGWVFPGEKGPQADKPVNMNDLSARIIAPACRAAGLKLWGIKKEKKGFYACRRGFATEMVKAGATLEETAQAMGNTAEVIQRNYFKEVASSTMASSGMARLAEKRAEKALASKQPEGRFFRSTPKQLAEGEVL